MENKSIRLNKYLAKCGIGSRRDCDTYIADGGIKVDGQVAQMGQKVTGEELIEFRGKRVTEPKPKEYYLYHKPRGPVCTSRDENGRDTIYDYLKKIGLDAPYLRYVGRLDMDSEGALILTNDGDLIHSITHPRFHIKKVYRILVPQKISQGDMEQVVEEGVKSEGEILHFGAIREKEKVPDGFWYEVDLYEGKNRQVRRVISAIGNKVIRLKRIQFANIKLRDLPNNRYRELTEREVKGLLSKGYK